MIIDLNREAKLDKAVRDVIENLDVFCNARYYEELKADKGFEVRRFSGGNLIYSRENFENALCIVIRGNVVITKNNAVGRVVLRKAEKGEILGVSALFGNGKTYASELVAGTSGTVVALVYQNAMQMLFEKDVSSAVAYVKLLTEKIRFLNGKIDSFTAGSAYDKLCRFLENQNSMTIPMQTLAEVLDVSRMTLYRNLDRLEAEGKIRRDGKNIIVISDR